MCDVKFEGKIWLIAKEKSIFHERREPMKRQLTMKLDKDYIRFTPDGKVAVVDAIKALSASDKPEFIWEFLKMECPEFNELYQDYDFHENKFEAVVDDKAWEKIETALLDYILDQNCSP